MFSRLFKPKFYRKSKSCVNTIKMRLEIIQRKRKAVQRFLKNDIAEFLRRGLDYTAYQRAAGLLMEYNKSSCYELVEKFAGCISNHLEDLSKQRDCPDECKEAVQSLIYAAARFADLPELRKLRTLFTEKYENSLEPYISKEFVEKLRQDLPAREMTIQLLHDIAGEFSIEWDSKALKQQLYRPASVHEERTKHGEWSNNNDGTNKEDQGRDFLSQGRNDVIIDDSGDEDETRSTDMSSEDGPRAASSYSSSVASVSEDEAENKRPFYYGLVPPPYLKPKPNDKVESNLQKTTALHEEKPKPRSVRSRPSAAMHVHPKLPDYDELATHLASIRGRQEKHLN